jgi:hypothetical protein
MAQAIPVSGVGNIASINASAAAAVSAPPAPVRAQALANTTWLLSILLYGMFAVMLSTPIVDSRRVSSRGTSSGCQPERLSLAAAEYVLQRGDGASHSCFQSSLLDAPTQHQVLHTPTDIRACYCHLPPIRQGQSTSVLPWLPARSQGLRPWKNPRTRLVYLPATGHHLCCCHALFHTRPHRQEEPSAHASIILGPCAAGPLLLGCGLLLACCLQRPAAAGLLEAALPLPLLHPPLLAGAPLAAAVAAGAGP